MIIARESSNNVLSRVIGVYALGYPGIYPEHHLNKKVSYPGTPDYITYQVNIPRYLRVYTLY